MKILLVQTSFLGDTILSTPVISAIKKKYPNSELCMLTTPLARDLVVNDPMLSKVFCYDKRWKDKGLWGIVRMSTKLRKEGFDIAYSLHKSYRTALLLRLAKIPKRIGFAQAKLSWLYTELIERPGNQHDVLRNLAILNDSTSTDLRLFIDPIKLPLNSLMAYKEKFNKYSILVPGSAWPTKRWHWQGYREIAEYLLSKNIGVVILGAANEKDVADKVSNGLNVLNFSGDLSIADSLAVMKDSALVVCNDSMALHAASAFKIPTVAIFCATSPEFGFGPWQNRAIVVQKLDLDCKPCSRHGTRSCPTGTNACMQELSAQEVIEAIEKLRESNEDKEQISLRVVS
jgi:heptosyltransferase II